MEACGLLLLKIMNIIDPICEHCDEKIQGTAYRVTSEEDGVVLLDMIVCHSCSIEARTLGLQTKEHGIRHAAFN
jgi:RNase P subunit RPR2